MDSNEVRCINCAHRLVKQENQPCNCCVRYGEFVLHKDYNKKYTIKFIQNVCELSVYDAEIIIEILNRNNIQYKINSNG